MVDWAGISGLPCDDGGEYEYEGWSPDMVMNTDIQHA